MEQETFFGLQRRLSTGRQPLRSAIFVVLISTLFVMAGRADASPSLQDDDPSPVVPVPDSATTDEDTPVIIDVLKNDILEGEGTLVVAGVGNPQSGTTDILGDAISYTPNADFNGEDTFFYTVHNGNPLNTRQGSVRVTVEPAPDAPANIELNNNTVSEDIAVGSIVGRFSSVVDGVRNGLFRSRTQYLLVEGDNDNDKFRVRFRQLRIKEPLDFETQQSYVIDVEASTRRGPSVTQRITINVTNANDAPVAIALSNDRLDENQPAGVTVGVLSTEDIEPEDTHTYTLVPGAGNGDNEKFLIEGDLLKTNALLDFERKPVYSIRIASTDSSGGSFEEIFLINVNNIPTPPDAVENILESCSGNPIELVQEGEGGTQVLVEITDITISNLSLTGCRVDGVMNITSNGSTVNNLPFSGVVNERDQFSSTSIPDFTINVAGLPLNARNVEIAYNNERPQLHIVSPELEMPPELGGLKAIVSVPTFIGAGGVRIGPGTIDMPTMMTDSGIELNLKGKIVQRDGGFQIDADGSLKIPNIGKKKDVKDDEGQTCTISAGVTIFADPFNRTVLEIKAGDALVMPIADPQAELLTPDVTLAPDAIERLQLEAIRAGLNCSPGLPIGTTGLFLTGMSGEITVAPGNERIDVVVNIEAGKEIPGLGPIVSLEGSMGFQPSPFELDLGVAMSVISVEVANAEAKITANSFRAAIRFQGLFTNGSAEINAFTRNGNFTFTGSARISLEVKKGFIVKSGRCGRGPFLRRVRLCPPALPPFSVGPLATVGADVGEFTNGRFGFKGFVRVGIFGTHGFFIDERGKLTFKNINRFQLIDAPTIRAAQALWDQGLAAGDFSTLNRVSSEFQFLKNVDGIDGNNGLIVSAPLTKVAAEEEFQTRGINAPTDIITQVNLIQHGDVIFTMVADNPLAFTLITPQGQEVTPENVDQSELLGYEIGLAEVAEWSLLEVDSEEGDLDEIVAPKLLFTPLSAEGVVNGVDLRVDGTVVYFNLSFPNSAEWLNAIPLAPGEHLIELVQTGTQNVVSSATVNLANESQISLISVGGSAPELVTISDDLSAPSTFGNSKIRFFNGSDTPLSLFVDDAPIHTNVAYKGFSDFAELTAGSKVITLRDGDSNIVAELDGVELADGGVYTFMSTDLNGGVTLIQRTDALYQPTFSTYYSVDQAVMNENWQMKVVGDTDNSFFDLAVLGVDSPPVLGSVTVDASDLAETEVSWQLTSDTRPTTVSVYVNPGEISATMPLTLTDGTVNSEEIPLYEGTLVAEYVIDDLNELGGQLVTKQIDLSDLPSGTYHLWVRADDGENPAVETYAQLPTVARAGTQSMYGSNAVRVTQDSFVAMAQVVNAAEIVIDHSNDFPTEWAATISNSFDPETRELYIEWEAHSHPDTDTYRLLIGETPLNPTQVITAGGSIQEFDGDGNPTGLAVGFLTVYDIRPGQPYFLSIEGVDQDSGKSVRSQEFTFIVDPGSFSISSAQATVNVEAGSSTTVPVTLNIEESLLFPNVWLSADLGGAPRGITARFSDDLDGMTTINPAKPTHQFEITVDASVADGTYPIEIAGYNGDAKETLIIQVVVGEGGPTGSTQTIFMPFISEP